ncbi:Nn.00g076700.m01.CDS01 [Neocucurbitaria sp. VM-36]
MADPLTIIGCVGAICNIIDASGKAITTLNGLRNRWTTADITLLTLATELTALKAALTKIQNLIEDNDPQVLHYQLIMDLRQSIECFKLLINALERVLTSLDIFGFRPLDFAQRLKISFSQNKVDDIEKLLQRQTSALTLLLTALSCTTLTKQERLMKRIHSSQEIKRAKSDSASVRGLRDSSSFASKWSDTLSRFSVEFDFDTEIFSARKILLLGDDESHKDKIIKEIHDKYLLQCTEEEISSCRLPLLKACLDHTKILIRTIEEHAVPYAPFSGGSQQRLLLASSLEDHIDPVLEEQILDAMIATWDTASSIPPIIFLKELKYLKFPNLYPPTAADFLRAKARHSKQEISTVGPFASKLRRIDDSQLTVLRIPDSTYYTSENLEISLRGVHHVRVLIDLERDHLVLARAVILVRALVTSFSRLPLTAREADIMIYVRNSDKFDDWLLELPLGEFIPDYDGANSFMGLQIYLQELCARTIHHWFSLRLVRLQKHERMDLVQLFQPCMLHNILRSSMV